MLSPAPTSALAGALAGVGAAFVSPVAGAMELEDEDLESFL